MKSFFKLNQAIVSVLLMVIFLVPSICQSANPELLFPVSIPKNDLLLVSEAKKKEIDPNDIKIFSWNIYKGEKEKWYEDFHEIANQGGIFLIQEYADSDGVDYTLSLRKEQEVLIGISYKIAMWGVTGVANISEVSSTYQRNFRTKVREDFTLKTYKTSLITKYPLKAKVKELMVVNVHLLNSVKSELYGKELDRLEKQIKNHDGPLVVAGDFNSWRKREPYVSKWKERLGLLEVGFVPDNRTRFDKNPPIDRIFFRGLNLVDSWSKKVKSSDHNPLGAQFSYTER